ncbi:hypothetical protein MCOR17_000915 [Pyricularia oryzae]|nr:hypothetical protein MCOR17_000915 [Pyricularia oryzae]
MQFSLALYIILPTLVAAVDPPATPGGSLQILPTSNVLCPIGIKCAASSDGTHRCLGLNGRAICATTCPTTSDCPARCKKQTLVNGFCTNGANPCICTITDGIIIPKRGRAMLL